MQCPTLQRRETETEKERETERGVEGVSESSIKQTLKKTHIVV